MPNRMELCATTNDVKMGILIIDSSVEIIIRMVALLSEVFTEAAIYTANTYAEAVTLLWETKPDVMLLDRELPGNNSLCILSQLKNTNTNPLVIVLSFYTDNIAENQYKRHGANFFLDKYHDFEKIPGIISNSTIDTLKKKQPMW